MEPHYKNSESKRENAEDLALVRARSDEPSTPWANIKAAWPPTAPDWLDSIASWVESPDVCHHPRARDVMRFLVDALRASHEELVAAQSRADLLEDH